MKHSGLLSSFDAQVYMNWRYICYFAIDFLSKCIPRIRDLAEKHDNILPTGNHWYPRRERVIRVSSEGLLEILKVLEISVFITVYQ